MLRGCIVHCVIFITGDSNVTELSNNSATFRETGCLCSLGSEGWGGRDGVREPRNLEAMCDARKLARVGEFLGDDMTTTTITGRREADAAAAAGAAAVRSFCKPLGTLINRLISG